MKKVAVFVISLVISLCLMSIAAFAANVSATLTGPDTVRAGDTLKVTFSINGSGLLGGSGTLSYDPGKLTLTEITQVVAAPWMVESNENNIVFYDNNQSNPIKENTALFTAIFKVNSSLAVGTTISVSMTEIVVSDGADINVGTVTYTKTIAPPMSTDNSLKSLTVSNAAISPAFSPDTTAYTAEVPFEVSKLDVSAVANDSKSTVSVNSPTLTPNGTTKVTVTVKAENGSTKTYTITVKRAQDPNYVPSGKNELSSITVTDFKLSPGFSADITSYVVWLPYETDSIQITGAAADSNASIEVIGGDNLEAGADNVVKVICTAENGEKKEYTIIAKRAAAHGSDPTVPDSTQPTAPIDPTTPDEPTVPSNPNDPSNPSAPGDPTEPSGPIETKPTETTPSATKPGDTTPESSADGVHILIVIAISVFCIGAGIAIGFFIGKKEQ